MSSALYFVLRNAQIRRITRGSKSWDSEREGNSGNDIDKIPDQRRPCVFHCNHDGSGHILPTAPTPLYSTVTDSFHYPPPYVLQDPFNPPAQNPVCCRLVVWLEWRVLTASMNEAAVPGAVETEKMGGAAETGASSAGELDDAAIIVPVGLVLVSPDRGGQFWANHHRVGQGLPCLKFTNRGLSQRQLPDIAKVGFAKRRKRPHRDERVHLRRPDDAFPAPLLPLRSTTPGTSWLRPSLDYQPGELQIVGGCRCFAYGAA